LGKVEKSGTAGKDRSVAVIAARSTALNTTGAALNNRVSLGPSLVVFYANDAWSAGLILQNAWSLVAAGGNRIDALVGALALGAISKK
jgi:glycerol uptake facilitator-like aquaporin